jgi:hypothetical protein
VRRHIAAYYSTSSDHRSFTNSYVRQDHTVRSNEDVPFNNNLSVTFWSSGPRVKVGDYRRSEADCTVVPYGYVRGMYFINVYKLANPDVVSDRNSAEPLQPRSQTESPRGNKSYPARKPTKQQRQPQRHLPLISLVCEKSEIGRVHIANDDNPLRILSNIFLTPKRTIAVTSRPQRLPSQPV